MAASGQAFANNLGGIENADQLAHKYPTISNFKGSYKEMMDLPEYTAWLADKEYIEAKKLASNNSENVYNATEATKQDVANIQQSRAWTIGVNVGTNSASTPRNPLEQSQNPFDGKS